MFVCYFLEVFLSICAKEGWKKYVLNKIKYGLHKLKYGLHKPFLTLNWDVCSVLI